MCGIAGIKLFKGQNVDPSTLKCMTDSISHRGPDGEGIWINDEHGIGLGHRRLSVIDLSEKAAQPMVYQEGNLVITYNGEIYNYLELRKDLISKGFKFYSDSDTEVLLALYALHGSEALKFLDGMFAFAIWDAKKKELFCARDRFGEKPFYFSKTDTAFVFASEMKALFASGLIKKELNHARLLNYWQYNLIEDITGHSTTFYKNVHSLEPASFLIIKQNGEMIREKYWTLSHLPSFHGSFNDAKVTFRQMLNSSIQKKLRSDVSVGTSLSGGMDSNSIVQIMRNLLPKDSDIKSFSARFKDFDRDEGLFIEESARRLNLDAHMVWCEENDLEKNINSLFYHQEEPFQSSSILAQWKVMELAKEQNTIVLLDGQGADESLAGYHHYFHSYLFELYRKSPKEFRTEQEAIFRLHGKKISLSKSLKAKAKIPLLLSILNSKKSFQIRPESLALQKEWVSEYGNQKVHSPFHTSLSSHLNYSLTNSGLHHLLRYSDRNAMAHSREVRLPYLDHKLVEFLHGLPANFLIHEGWTKYIQRKAFDGELPQNVVWRKEKVGYETPQKKWLQSAKIQSLYRDSESLLVNKHILRKNAEPEVWKTIMTAQLLEF